MRHAELTFESLVFYYQAEGWSLDVPGLCLGREAMTCVVGPNGSGKSTLLRLAAGMLEPVQGSVSLNGCPLASSRRRAIARTLGFLPQESPLLFDLTVEDIAAMGRYAHLRGLGLMTPEDREAVDRALADVGMTERRRRPVSHLSGGERRRAMIASVLAQGPDLLLLDEPTSSLDVHHAVSVMRLLARCGQAGTSVVIVTHDINLAALFGERLLLLKDGRIHADGPPREVVTQGVLADAYGDDVLVKRHPETGGPLMIPRRDTHAEEGTQ